MSEVSGSHVRLCWNMKTVLEDINNPPLSWILESSSTPWWQNSWLSQRLFILLAQLADSASSYSQPAESFQNDWFFSYNIAEEFLVFCAKVNSVTYFNAMITLYANAIASGALWLIGIREMSCCLKLIRECNSALSLLGETNTVELIVVRGKHSVACSWPAFAKPLCPNAPRSWG